MCRYDQAMVRWTWTQTPKGNWICQSGKYVAVAEWQGSEWEIRVKTDTGISITTHRATSPAELETTVQQLIQDIARQFLEVNLLDIDYGTLGRTR
ncbi:MAG: hypothetical protein M3R24_28070 [Chloroflexota bacterium]|nr:hypothetical protein [Chloroflexota bacterium]